MILCEECYDKFTPGSNYACTTLHQCTNCGREGTFCETCGRGNDPGFIVPIDQAELEKRKDGEV